MEQVTEFISSTGGLAVKGALLAAFLDFAFGVFAALRDGTFAIDAVAAFVRKHLLGRVFPISLMAIVAWYSEDAVMTAAAGAALLAYTAETMGSIYDSLKAPPADPVLTEAVNPIPTD